MSYVDIATVRPDARAMGSYVHVFRRGDQLLAELAFFDGDRDLAELEKLQRGLEKTIRLMRAASVKGPGR